MINKLLDKSIYFSFDKTGFKRHEKKFEKISSDSFKGKRYLVTGGTSGIGQSIVQCLRSYGAEVHFTGRRVTEEPGFSQLDLADHNNVLNFVKKGPVYDGVILNAGGMPADYKEHHGYETQFSSQVLGHYIILRAMIDSEKIKSNGQFIWMSSGGMYMVKYQERFIKDAQKIYDKVNFYANAKRAQVILNDHLHNQYQDTGVRFSVMHPGWVDTSGVRDAIPGFFNFTKNRLRTPIQGGDTAVWLLSKSDNPSGEFWFDRQIQKKVVFPWTKNSPEEKRKLTDLCEDHYQFICQN